MLWLGHRCIAAAERCRRQRDGHRGAQRIQDPARTWSALPLKVEWGRASPGTGLQAKVTPSQPLRHLRVGGREWRMESVVLEEWFAVPPKRLYRAWLDSEEHGAFTGGEAEIDPVPGGAFSAWDGYISGTTLVLDPPRRIEQAWRTIDFPPDAPELATGARTARRARRHPVGPPAHRDAGGARGGLRPGLDRSLLRADEELLGCEKLTRCISRSDR